MEGFDFSGDLSEVREELVIVGLHLPGIGNPGRVNAVGGIVGFLPVIGYFKA